MVASHTVALLKMVAMVASHTWSLVKMIGLFCKRDLSKRRYSSKATYNLKEPTNRSHPIATIFSKATISTCDQPPSL